MEIYDRAETGIQMLCGTWYMDGGYVSTRLMNVCAAMESIHSGLYDRPRMPEKDWEALERQALAGVGESEDRRTLHELLNNRMFFKQRALNLAAHIGDQGAGVDAWAPRVLTHYELPAPICP